MARCSHSGASISSRRLRPGLREQQLARPGVSKHGPAGDVTPRREVIKRCGKRGVVRPGDELDLAAVVEDVVQVAAVDQVAGLAARGVPLPPAPVVFHVTELGCHVVATAQTRRCRPSAPRSCVPPPRGCPAGWAARSWEACDACPPSSPGGPSRRGSSGQRPKRPASSRAASGPFASRAFAPRRSRPSPPARAPAPPWWWSSRPGAWPPGAFAPGSGGPSGSCRARSGANRPLRGRARETRRPSRSR